MLVQCKSCNVSFDDAFGKCIACGEPVTLSNQELREHCIRKARNGLREGRKVGDIRNELISEHGFTDQEAGRIISAAKLLRRENARRKGRQVAVTGLVFIGIGIGLTALSLGMVLFYGFIVFGVIFFLGGLFVSTTGWDPTGDNEM